jgi:hydrogenase maturation factor HypF (carbamoyltransferase family)
MVMGMTTNPDAYVCEYCGRAYLKGRTDEEAMAEALELFGDALGVDPAVICDDCHKQFMRWAEELEKKDEQCRGEEAGGLHDG